MTEYSIGVQINGKEMEIPTLVPTLTKAEIDIILSAKPGDKSFSTPAGKIIVQKAADHAKARVALGKSPFADESESPAAVAPFSIRGSAIKEVQP